MTSPYLTQPCRSEAEAVLDKCEAIRQAAANFQTNIRKRIQEVGGEPEWIELSDMLSDALRDVESAARELTERPEATDRELRESGEMYGFGLSIGRVA